MISSLTKTDLLTSKSMLFFYCSCKHFSVMVGFCETPRKLCVLCVGFVSLRHLKYSILFCPLVSMVDLFLSQEFFLWHEIQIRYLSFMHPLNFAVNVVTMYFLIMVLIPIIITLWESLKPQNSCI